MCVCVCCVCNSAYHVNALYLSEMSHMVLPTQMAFLVGCACV